MHYYKFNIADYRKDTTHLSALEHGIYRQLLDWYYLDELPIPKETQSVSRRLRLASADEVAAMNNVLADFFELKDDGYHQSRCDEAIKEYHRDSEKNKANGKLGGRPKKTQSVILGNPEVSQTEPTLKATTNSGTINQELIEDRERPGKPAKRRAQIPDDFYPNDTGLNAIQQTNLDLKRELIAFTNHHKAKGSVMADWQAAWRTWVSNGVKFAKPQPAQQESFKERDARLGRERWEQMTGRIHPDNPEARRLTVIDQPFLELT